jgi:hypothetical protein
MGVCLCEPAAVLVSLGLHASPCASCLRVVHPRPAVRWVGADWLTDELLKHCLDVEGVSVKRARNRALSEDAQLKQGRQLAGWLFAAKMNPASAPSSTVQGRAPVVFN